MNKIFCSNKIKKKIYYFSIEKYLNNFAIFMIIILFFARFDENIEGDGSKIGFVELGRKKMRFVFGLKISLRRNEIIFIVLSLGIFTIFFNQKILLFGIKRNLFNKKFFKISKF